MLLNKYYWWLCQMLLLIHNLPVSKLEQLQISRTSVHTGIRSCLFYTSWTLHTINAGDLCRLFFFLLFKLMFNFRQWKSAATYSMDYKTGGTDEWLNQHYIQRGKKWYHVSNLSSLTKVFKTRNHFTSEPQDLVVLTAEILPYLYEYHFTRKRKHDACKLQV